MVDEDAYRKMMRYYGQVEALIEDLSGYVDEGVLNESRRLASFGEAPIGLGLAAWWIVEREMLVPGALLRRIVELTEDISVPGVDVPANILDFSADG